MKKAVIYFSDIVGTILGNQENSAEDYQKFNLLLSKIKESEKADEIIFSFISTDNQQMVSKVQETFHPYIGQTVTYGRQYFQNGYYTKDNIVKKESLGKAVDIAQFVGELSCDYEITSVYYADDVEMYHEMLFFFAEDNQWSQKLHSIKPSKNIGLAEVNQLLESDLMEHLETQKQDKR